MDYVMFVMYTYCIYDIRYVGKEKWNEINVMLWMKIMGPNECMYVVCIGILPRYVMLVRTRMFNIYVSHDIMHAFSFLMCLVMCNVFSPTKLGRRGMYTSPFGGPMCAYMGRVWRSTMHPILPGTRRSLRSCYIFKRSVSLMYCMFNTRGDYDRIVISNHNIVH